MMTITFGFNPEKSCRVGRTFFRVQNFGEQQSIGLQEDKTVERKESFIWEEWLKSISVIKKELQSMKLKAAIVGTI